MTAVKTLEGTSASRVFDFWDADRSRKRRPDADVFFISLLSMGTMPLLPGSEKQGAERPVILA